MKTAIYTHLIIALFAVVFITGSPVLFAEDLKAIKLTAAQVDKGKLLMEALRERRSTRSFNSKELPIETLSNLLWAAFGINRPEAGKHTAPSAMNFQEIDIYVAMKGGLYLYRPDENILAPVLKRDIRAFTGKQEFTQIAPVNLIYVADFSKMSGSEEDKVFYSAVDTGFISQNVYLYCASEGLSTVVLGWVEKSELARIMRLKKDQRIILTQPVGYSE